MVVRERESEGRKLTRLLSEIFFLCLLAKWDFLCCLIAREILHNGKRERERENEKKERKSRQDEKGKVRMYIHLFLIEKRKFLFENNRSTTKSLPSIVK